MSRTRKNNRKTQLDTEDLVSDALDFTLRKFARSYRAAKNELGLSRRFRRLFYKHRQTAMRMTEMDGLNTQKEAMCR